MYNKAAKRGKRTLTFQQVTFKIQDSVTITVNELFTQGKFISSEDFCTKNYLYP